MVTFLDAAYHLRRIVPISRWTPLFGLAALLLCLFLWRRLAARLGWRPVPTLIALLALAGALSITLSPRGDWWGNRRTLAQCFPDGWARLGTAAARVGGNTESWLNIALLLPLGLALVLACRRAAGPALLVVLLPAAIEMTQTVTPGRECSPSDYLANALGGLVGVVIGALVDRWWRGRRAVIGPGGPPDALAPPASEPLPEKPRGDG